MSALLDATRTLAHTLDFACSCLLWGRERERKKKDYPIHRDPVTKNRGRVIMDV